MMALGSRRNPYKEGVAEREHACLSVGNAEGPDSQKVILDKILAGVVDGDGNRQHPLKCRVLSELPGGT